METGIAFRFALVLAMLAAAVILLFPYFPTLEQELYLELSTGPRSKWDMLLDVAEHIFAALGIWILVFNGRAILYFIKRSVEGTDNLIIGDWYIYRYTVSHGKPVLICDKWTICRALSRGYTVILVPHDKNRKDNKGLGHLVYNERDRFSVLFGGTGHKEQSLVCFSPRICLGNDTRTFGLGVGDDADYVLSSRPYLACRTKLDESHVRDILDGAVEALRANAKTPLIQFPTHVMNELFQQYPWPAVANCEREPLSHGVLHNIYAWGRGMLVGPRRI